MRRPTRRDPNRKRPGSPPPPRDPRPGGSPPHVVLIFAGLAIYLGVLWLGVAVLEDTPLRSAAMAALILAIAAAGYIFTRPQPPGRR